MTSFLLAALWLVAALFVGPWWSYCAGVALMLVMLQIGGSSVGLAAGSLWAGLMLLFKFAAVDVAYTFASFVIVLTVTHVACRVVARMMVKP